MNSLPESGREAAMDKRAKVLFLSTGDATRGQMAEGLLRAASHDELIAANAAIESIDSDQLTDEVMREAGVDISTQKPLPVKLSLSEHFGYVITLFDSSRERSPVFPFTTNLLRWNLRDPRLATGTPEQRKAAFRQVRDEIGGHIREFLREHVSRQRDRAA
jgi:protein-tyrosine-phosphatase